MENGMDYRMKRQAVDGVHPRGGRPPVQRIIALRWPSQIIRLSVQADPTIVGW